MNVRIWKGRDMYNNMNGIEYYYFINEMYANHKLNKQNKKNKQIKKNKKNI